MILNAMRKAFRVCCPKNSRRRRVAKFIAKTIQRCGSPFWNKAVHAVAQQKIFFEDISSPIDINQCGNLSIRNWPRLSAALESGDRVKALLRLRTSIAVCEKNNLFLQELGGIRLLSRITEGKENNDKRCRDLIQRIGAIPLTGGYVLCAHPEGSDIETIEDGNIHGSVYSEYDRRGITKHALEDASFSIRAKNGEVVLTASASIIRSGGVFGNTQTRPIIPAILSDDKAGVAAALAESLPFLQIIYGAKDVLVSEIDNDGLLLYRSLVRQQASFSAQLFVYPYVDLNNSDEAIRGDIRKRSRPLINWGSKNLKIEDFSGSLLTDAMVNDIYQFLERHHASQIAQQGANYMPRWSFNYTIELCRAGRGEASIAFDSSGAMVGVSVVIYEDCDVAYYKEGAYDHDVQGKSPAPSLLLHCIFRAKAKGFKVFKPNRVLPAPISYLEDHRTEWEPWRWANCYFKDGFSSTVISKVAYGFEGCRKVTSPPC